MPKFLPGERKTARVPIRVGPAGLACDAEVYLVSDGAKVGVPGTGSFISTGVEQKIPMSVTMPQAEGIYPVWIDVFTGGIRILAYKSIEDVTIETPVQAAVFDYDSEILHTKWNDTLDVFGVWVKNIGNIAGECTMRFRAHNPGSVLQWMRQWPAPITRVRKLQPGERWFFGDISGREDFDYLLPCYVAALYIDEAFGRHNVYEVNDWEVWFYGKEKEGGPGNKKLYGLPLR